MKAPKGAHGTVLGLFQLHDQPGWPRQLAAEFAILQSLVHPRLPRAFALVEAAGQTALALEWVAGGDAVTAAENADGLPHAVAIRQVIPGGVPSGSEARGGAEGKQDPPPDPDSDPG